MIATASEPETVGELIRFWRTNRRMSQLELSLEANISTKHLSFVETGRSQPSRQLLIHLAQQLDLPIAERNRVLLRPSRPPVSWARARSSWARSPSSSRIRSRRRLAASSTVFEGDTRKLLCKCHR